MKKFYKIIITLFIIVACLFGITQLRIVKTKINSYVLHIAHKKGLLLNIKKISGALPFFYTLEGVELPITNEEKITIETLSFKISPLPLLQKKLYLTDLSAKNVKIEKLNLAPLAVAQSKTFHKLPCVIYLKSFKIEQFTLSSNVTINVSGKIKIDENIENIFMDVKVTRQNFNNSFLKLATLGSKKNNSVTTKIELKAENAKLFSPIFTPSLKGTAFVKASMKGSWKSHLALLSKSEEKLPPIVGTINGFIAGVQNTTIDIEQNLTLSSYFQLNTDLSLAMKNFYLTAENFNLNGNISFSNQGQAQKAFFFLKLNDLSTFSSLLPKGKVKAELNFVYPTLDLSISSPLFQYHDLTFFNVTGIIKTDINTLCGYAEVNGKKANQFLSAKGDFSIIDQGLKLTNATIKSSVNTAVLNLIVNKNLFLNGEIQIDAYSCDNLYALIKQENFPLKIQKIKANVHFEEKDKKQQMSLSLKGDEFNFYSLRGDIINLTATMNDIFNNFSSNLYINCKNSHFYTMKINNFNINTNTDGENWPFSATLDGTFQKPIKLTSKGFWHIKDYDVLINVQAIEGYALDKPLSSTQPIQLEWAKDRFLLKDLDIALNSAQAKANITIVKDNADIRFILDHFPLEFFSLNPENIIFHGSASMQAYLTKKAKNIDGNIDLKIEKALINAPLSPAINGELSLKMTMQNNNVLLKSYLIAQNQKLMEMNATFPIIMNFFPFSLSIPSQEQIKAQLLFNGNIENLLSFIDIKSHYAEGMLKCNLTLFNTVQHPKVTGELSLEKGYYENYFTGTALDNIKAKCVAKNDHITLKEFKADDCSGGNLTANGYIDFKMQEMFPFSIDTEFSNFSWIQKEWLTTKTQGKVKFIGNLKKAKAQGNIFITNTTMSIPNPPETQVFEAPVIYASGEIQPQITPMMANLYPIDMDMQLDSPGKIFINGKGIESEWKGKLKLKGSLDNILAEGKLELLHGKFSFSGRHFNLLNGAVTFKGTDEEPQLSIVGEMKMPNVTLIANVKGPLSNPEITFSSSPALPISSIISLLLFGKEATEITGTQAEQIIAAINAINTNQPISKESARKSLGLDRFSIATSPVRNIEELNKVSIQVGQYLINGLMVSVSQGTQQDASTIIVELNLAHGFVLQLESQQDTAQGKFILKWKHNY